MFEYVGYYLVWLIFYFGSVCCVVFVFVEVLLNKDLSGVGMLDYLFVMFYFENGLVMCLICFIVVLYDY